MQHFLIFEGECFPEALPKGTPPEHVEITYQSPYEWREDTLFSHLRNARASNVAPNGTYVAIFSRPTAKPIDFMSLNSLGSTQPPLVKEIHFMAKRWKATAFVRDTRPEKDRSPRGQVRLGKPAIIITETAGEALSQMEEYLAELMPDLQSRVTQITVRSDERPGASGNPLLAAAPRRGGKKKKSA